MVVRRREGAAKPRPTCVVPGCEREAPHECTFVLSGVLAGKRCRQRLCDRHVVGQAPLTRCAKHAADELLGETSPGRGPARKGDRDG